MNTLKKNLKFTVLLLVSLMIVLGVPVLGYAEITAVSDRTAEVRDAIVTAAGVNTADEVTETHLAAITSLNLRSTGIAELESGDFSGMTGLTSLNLYNNELSILPDGIFEGLTALTSIRLGGNTVDPLPITITLEKSEDGQFKAIVPIGAPFDIVLPISATNGSISDSATSLTIAKGSTESGAVTVSRTADTTDAVTANIGTLPGLPRNHYGYVLTKSDALPLEVISEVTSTTPVVPDPVEPDPVVPEPVEPDPVVPEPVEEPDPVVPDPVVPEPETPTNTAPVFTDGSTAIRSIAENTAAGAIIGTAVSATDANEDDSLTYALGGVDAASFDIEQTTGQLKTKRALDYEMKRVYSVTISATDGTLTDTITVIISVIDVDDMPFVSTTLAVSDRTPEVRDAIVAAVTGVTDAGNVTDAHLEAITFLNLRSAGVSELKSGDFSGMTGLTNLNLYGNMLSTLPIGIFEGLTSMTSLRLGGNLVDPLPLIVSLQQIDSGEFQAVVHTGAPFDIVLPIGAMMITIPQGSLTSASFTDTSTPNISALPGLPANNFGYTLAKSSVYNRTPQVRDAIFAALSDVNDYRNVTEVDLATITALNLSSMSITSLKAGDFAGMLSLTTLNLDNNQLTSLPGSIFGGLPSLTTLHLSNNQLTNLPDGFFTGIASLSELNVSGNSVSPLQLTVSLEKVGENQIKAVAPVGAPFDIVMPINVVNGSIDGTTLTISTGNVESESLTVTRTPGTTAAVTVDIATLPSPLSGHTGYALVKSNQQPLEVFEDINIAPVFIEGASTARNIAENTEAGVNIGGPVTATDSNNDTLTYSLNGTDTASFEIDSETGQLKTLADLDFETKFTYSVSITASDGRLTDTITVTINVSDIDEDAPVDNVVDTRDDETPNNAPEFTEGESVSLSVAENTGSGVDIGTAVSATDADKDTLTYSLDGTDADSFSINSTNGQVRTKAALDYETKSSYSVTITVSDGNDGSDMIAVTITVTDVEERLTNSAPEFTDGESVSLSVAENTGSGVNIGDAISATDADADTLTYSLDGTDADSFSINSTNGQVRTNASLDYETKSSYSVSITVSDGYNGSDTITVTITVTDVEERLANNAPVFTDGSSTTRSVAENTGSGVNIGTAVSATDADADTLTYSLGGTDSSSFSINSTNGQLRTNASLDYETKSSYSVSITVSDGYNGSDTITVTVNVTDVDETPANNAPVFTETSPATRSIAENTTSDVNIGSAVSATDADNDTLTYGLTGTDASVFSIDNSNGQLQTSNSLDYETKSSYSVTVTVSDVNGGSDTITVTINITDANDAPVFADGVSASRTIPENTGANINIGTAVKATDPDTDDSLTYTLGGTDAASFAIDDKTGQLKTKSSLDYETKISYTVTVSVSDGSLEDEITVTINVKDLDETPSNIPPVFTEGDDATRTIAENTAADTNIGTPIAATDADSETLAYVLSGTDASPFSIDDETGQLKTSGALNYETKDSYTVTVTVSDGSQNDTITVTINVTNANDAPVFAATNDTALTIAENTAAGTNIGTAFAASDEDSDTLTFSLGGTDAGSYDIGSGSGQLKTKSALDFETKPSYSVEIVVSDGNNGSDTHEVGITVTDVDENLAPVFTDGTETTRAVAENTGSGVDIGTKVEATDADGDTLEYELRGTDAALFSINSTSGQLRTKAALDFETDPSYSVRIRVSDGNNGVARIDVTINVTDVAENRAPVFEAETTTREVAENTASGVNIGAPVGATDADDDDTLEYSLGGTDNASFSIDSTNGQLRTNAALNYEMKSSYLVSVTVTDGNGGSDTIAVTINVADVDENRAPVFTDGTATERAIAENTGSGVDIGAPIGATDMDDDDTLEYSLGGTDNASFSIDSTNGQLRTDAALDYEMKSSYSVSVTVTDGNGGSDTITVNITVSDVDENRAPTFTDGTSTSRSIAENTATSVNIGSPVSAIDLDTDTLVYSLGGTDAASFDIDTGSGQLKTKAALDHETKSRYTVTVSVSDGNNGSDTITVNITVSDVDENRAPTFTDGTSTSRSIAENTATSVNIGSPVSATDLDTDTLTYSLGGTNAAAFSIDTGSGQLKTKAALDYEMKSSYVVTVSVSDGNGGSDTITVNITVSDVGENAPTFANNSFSFRISNIGDVTAGDSIGTPITAADADNDTLEYTVGGDDASLFDIDSSSGQLKVTTALINDSSSSYSIKVIADDGNGGTAEIAGIIYVTRVSTQVSNNTPVFTDSNPTTRSIAENTASGQNIGTSVGATDADTGDTLTYTLGGTDAASFSIVDTSGQLQTKVALNYETKTSYTVTVTVTDDSGVSNASASITVNITITDVDDTSITPVSNRTPEVRDAIVSAISGVSDPADVTATHLATITSLNLRDKSISSLSDGDFDGLTALGSINFRHNPDLTSLPSGIFDDLVSLTSIRLDDCQLSSLPSGLFDNTTSLVELDFYGNALSSLPSGIFENLSSLVKLYLGSNRFSSIPSGLFVNLTSLTTFYIDDSYDEDDGDEDEGYALYGDLSLPVSLALVQSGVFKAVAPTGAPFDIVLPITVINGSISGGATSITIPKGSVESTSLTVTQDTGTTAAVAVSIGNLPSIPSDHDGYELTKGGALIVISGGNAAPVFTDGSSTTRTIEETDTSGLNIGSPVDATDAENQTLTYTLGGTDAASFSIVSASGQLKTKEPLDSDTKNSYTVTVTTTDTSGASNNSTTITVTINVSSRTSNNAPIFTVGTSATRSVVENTAAGVNFGSPIRASDADSDTLEYTLSGTDGDSFGIVSTNGQLQTKDPLDYATKSSYTVIVTVSDRFGGSDTITVTIDVINVAEGTLITPVSDRTPEVRDAIVNKISGVSDPADVTAAHLATITSLDLRSKSISSLSDGDFDGLTALRNINFQHNLGLTSLPSGIFDGLTALESIKLDVCGLTSLPSGVFDGLTSLQELILYNNELSSLPSGIFEDLTSLTKLGLSGNLFTTIPSGIFVNLTSLTTLYLDDNSVDPLPLPVSLEAVQSGEFKAVAPTGAPFDIVVPISVTNGTISGGATSLTISKGSVDSASLTVTRNTGTTAAVAVSIGSLSSIPSSTHDGYVLTKGENLKPISGDNSAPTFTDTTNTTFSVAELTPSGTNIGTAFSATDDDDDTLTWTTGGTDGDSFSIVTTSGQLQTKDALDYETKTSYSVTVTVSDGYGGTASIDVTINVTDIYDVIDPPLSERNEKVVVAVRLELGNYPPLDSITYQQLSSITGLNLKTIGLDISSLKASDFNGMTSLKSIDMWGNAFSSFIPSGIFDGLPQLEHIGLGENRLGSIPANFFDNLTSLKSLDLYGNRLASLPEGIFDNLTSLERLNLSDNGSLRLRSGVFDNLTSLKSIILYDMGWTSIPDGLFDNLNSLTSFIHAGGRLTSLPADLFEGMTSLRHILLYDNNIASLPAGLFEGLTSLGRVLFYDNRGAPFPMTLSLEKVADGEFKAKVDTGAIIDLVIGVTVTNGSIDGAVTTITIPAGNLESDNTLTVTRTSGTTAAVTVDITTLPSFGTPPPIGYSNWEGFEFVKSVTLPLEVIPAVGGAPNSTIEIPDATNLLPNYPNPFNPETWIPYQLSKSSDVTLTIYNMRGVVVREVGSRS